MTHHVLAAIIGAAQHTPPPLDRARAVAMAAVLSALADPTRLQVFRAISDAGTPGASLRDLLAPGGDRAVVREALNQLEAVGLIRRTGPGRRYTVDPWTQSTFGPLFDTPESPKWRAPER